MESCFLQPNCEGNWSLYITEEIATKLGVEYGQLLSKPWYRSHQEEACLVAERYLANDGIIHPRKIRNKAWNEILLEQRDKQRVSWKAVDAAILAKSHASPPYFRPGFDVSIPLPPRADWNTDVTARLGPRKYFVTFKGTVYVRSTIGWFRESLLKLHNPKEKIVVVTTCDHQTNQQKIRKTPMLAHYCKSNASAYKEYSYSDLLNTTFSLVPAGRQPASYRFLESLRAGAVPVLIRSIHHPYVLPFDQIICWPRCVVSVLINSYTGDHHANFQPDEDWVANLRRSLFGMGEEELKARQQACARILDRHFHPPVLVVDSLVQSIQANKNGWVDPCVTPIK